MNRNMRSSGLLSNTNNALHCCFHLGKERKKNSQNILKNKASARKLGFFPNKVKMNFMTQLFCLVIVFFFLNRVLLWSWCIKIITHNVLLPCPLWEGNTTFYDLSVNIAWSKFGIRPWPICPRISLAILLSIPKPIREPDNWTQYSYLGVGLKKM